MKLFMIWYLGSQIILTAGPLPYGEEECRYRAAKQLEYVTLNDKDNIFKGMAVECEFHDEAPRLSKR